MGGFGLLGQKLGHSYSPAIHKALGGYDYRLFEVKPDDLAGFLQREDFRGLNVTIPYKQAVMQYCAELTPVARSIGSVNTILRREDGSLLGHNTDASGFSAMINQSGTEIRGAKVLVLGSGGSSLSVRHVLRELGAGEIVTISRSGEEHYGNLHRHADAQVLINTTPVGMYPQTDARPVDLAALPNLQAVLDIIYNPARTRLLMQASERGVPHMGGLVMLVGQARTACELFLGEEIPAAREREVTADLRRQTENIVLVGMPGCGKTTIARQLAHQMGRPLVDCDLAIEAAAGMSIPEIFRLEGEDGFRQREAKILNEYGKRSGLVISTGGGCVARRENYFSLRQNGVVIFLEREISKLARKGRPLSQSGDLARMHAERLPLYRQFADLTVQNNASPDAVAKNILEAAYEFIGH